MHYVRTLFVAFLITAACSAPPEEQPSSEGPVLSHQTAQMLRSERAVPDQYIVALRDEAVAAHPNDIATVASELAARHQGTVLFTYQGVLKGFTVRMPRARLEALLRDPRVAYVEEDSYVELAGDPSSFRAPQTGSGEVETTGIQTPAPWGLDRIDQRLLPLDSSFRVAGTGPSVRVYVVDTGILLNHVEFSGRVFTGFDAITSGGSGNDCNGHGTHMAGIVGGTTYGVAKSVKLYPVRVLNCSGSGTASGIISALDWLQANHVKPAVAVIGWTLSSSSTVDTAMTNAINSGLLFVVAAGNNNASACNYTPARVPSALTVGSTTNTDARQSFTNFGSCLDFFAPGANIPSAWVNGGSYTMGGTEMAAAHVSGAAALILQVNPTASPAAVTSTLLTNATTGLVTSAGTGSPNRLLHVPPPAILITSPTGGSVSGTVFIETWTPASAGVTRVEFYMGSTLLGSDTSAPFSLSWDSTPYPGPRTLTAKAYNGSTLLETSPAVSVTVVVDTTPPTTELTAPSASATVSGTVTLTASASDDVGVSRVEFYAGPTFLGSDTTAPYSFDWNTTLMASGSYSLSSRAYDAAGNGSVSFPVSVTVAN